MNILTKIYCRIYQEIFKLAIPILPYTSPTILNSVSQIPDVLAKRNIDNVFIVTDSQIHNLGLADSLKAVLKKSNIKYTIYDKTQPNPTVSNVEQALAEYKACGAGCLIGLGGGSSIDCAKAVGARAVRKKPISKMEGILRIILPIPYLIAIPTTAGTGSEVTVTTVITDDKTHHKFPISDFCLIPKVAVLDAELTKTLPGSITGTTGMDALTHAVEAFIGRSAVKSTKADALEAVRLIGENLQKAYTNGEDTAARVNMLTAAFLAGRAFSKSYVGYCHAVAHALGGKYGIAHGLANAVLLPYTLKAYGEVIYPKLKELAIAMKIAHKDTDTKEAALSFIRKIEDMNNSMGIPDKLSGIKKEDIPTLAAYAAKEANPLYPVPVLMDTRELEKLFFDVMED